MKKQILASMLCCITLSLSSTVLAYSTSGYSTQRSSLQNQINEQNEKLDQLHNDLEDIKRQQEEDEFNRQMDEMEAEHQRQMDEIDRIADSDTDDDYYVPPANNSQQPQQSGKISKLLKTIPSQPLTKEQQAAHDKIEKEKQEQKEKEQREQEIISTLKSALGGALAVIVIYGIYRLKKR